MAGNRLQNADGQTVFRAIEIEDLFTGCAALLLLPLEQFFDLRVLDDGNPFIVVDEPLDYLRQRVIVDIAVWIASKNGRVWRGSLFWL